MFKTIKKIANFKKIIHFGRKTKAFSSGNEYLAPAKLKTTTMNCKPLCKGLLGTGVCLAAALPAAAAGDSGRPSILFIVA
ncbi:MAG: hypothetical protein LUH46_12840, partial [Alistipes sp.]|nr:hypothetical protein [Alistipes sp.]